MHGRCAHSRSRAPSRQLLHHFYTEGEKSEETYLNLVMDFVPQTVYSMSRQYAKAKKAFPTLFMKLYVYQVPAHGLEPWAIK